MKRFLFPLLIGSAAAQIPAFPGAEGYGGYAKGGRGGDVYIVTNLNASGAGSFRNGIETVPSAGRTIVFAVSGHIHINGLRLVGSKVTIAGQTAPGDGVGLINGTFRISGDDVVVRHLRFRHRKSGSGGDCVNLDSGSINSMLDSVSMQFSTDENFSSFNSPPENVTMQWSLNGWGLESHSCGGLWDQNHATCHHSLWSHNHTRNPKARPNGLLEWINNVTFDWDIGFIMGDSQTPASWKSNVIGSYFLSPPGNTRSTALEKALVARNGNPNFSVHLHDNRHDSDGDGLLNGTDKGYAIIKGSEFTPGDPAGANRYVKSPTPFSNAGAIPVTTDDPVVAFKKIVSKAGPLRLDIDPAKPLRDEVDTRMIQNLVTQTRNHISRESDLAGVSNGGIGTLNSTAAPLDADRDGMPDFYEASLGWNPAVQDHNTALANSGGFITGTTFMPAGTVAGYTRLEEYLHFLAIPHGTVAKNTAGEPTSVQVDLRKFTAGFSNAPVFTVSNITGGTIVQSGAGNAIATFTPTLNFVGRARFDFTVTDAAGHSWTQTCALVITNAGLPRDLKWQGGQAANAWNETTPNWPRNGTATAFGFGDRVALDDTGSQTPAVAVTGTVAPSAVDFDAAGNYTLGGTGAVTSTGTLTKRGSGTLTISNTGVNSFPGTTLDAGTISLGNETANASGLGNGPVTMNSGILNLYNTGPGGSFTGTLPNPLVVNGDVTINAAARCGFTGALSGAGTLNLFIPYVRTDWGGNPALFTGTLNILTDGDGGEFRINSGGSGNITNYGAARIRLPDHINAYYLPNPPNGGDKTQTVQIGELSTSGSGAGVILGGANGAADRTVHWKVGALNTSTTFGGSIQNRTGPAAFTKLGSGTLTLTGASTATGATTVAAGGLLVHGSLGTTAVTVASGALLGGDGSFAGPITASAGAFLSPGTVPFTGATLTANNGLTLGGTTLYFDLSDTPGGANDRIAMSGTLAMSGTQHFQFLLLQGALNEGTYDLITGATNSTASGVTLTHNLPPDSRQTFTLNRSAAGSNPSKVWLTVTGNPATLTWSGATNGTWDTTSAGNWTGAVPGTFFNNDDVLLNDTTALRHVTLPRTVAPRAATVNTAGGYTFAGPGGIGGSATLTKAGSGTLTITPDIVNVGTTTTAGSNQATVADAAGLAVGMTVNGGGFPYGSVITAINGTTLTMSAPTATAATSTLAYHGRHGFTGGTFLNGGTIQLGNEAGNRWGLGTGAVTFHGGTLRMFDSGTGLPGAGDLPNAFIVPAGQTGTLHTPQRGSLSGSLTGGGVFNVVVRYVRGDFYGDWSGFTGQLNISAATGSEFRMAESYAPDGFPNAAVNLGANVAMKHVGILAQGAGTVIGIGELSGEAGSSLLGGITGGRALTYVIGGKGTNATFAGVIGEQTPGSTLTNIVKRGTGNWTLSGTSAWAGGTAIEQGSLTISGNVTSTSAVNVAGGASLNLMNGTLATDVVNLESGGTFTSYGTLAADLNLNGTFEGRGFASGTPGTLAVQGSAFLGDTSLTRLRGGVSSDLIAVNGDLALGGTVQVILAPGTGFGRYPLFNYGGTLDGSAVLTGIPNGTAAHLSTTTAGQVALVIDDSDEDGLPDSWEQTNFGGLGQSAAGDKDGDGTSNLAEYRLGLNPSSGSSTFHATLSGHTLTWPSAPGIVFTVKRSVSLESGTWQTVGSVTGGAGNTASFNDPASLAKAFYVVEFTP